jgi:predicted glycogen debranching enzyme
VNFRNHHNNTHVPDNITAHPVSDERLGEWMMAITPVNQGLEVRAFPDAPPFYLLSGDFALTPTHYWQRNYDLALERYRGLDPLDDHLQAATAEVCLSPGDTVAFVCSTQVQPLLDHAQALEERHTYSHQLLQNVPPHLPPTLVLGADQFIVNRSTVNPQNQQREPGKTIIAGYPWFGDWGRDTMISLPGLTLVTQRYAIARKILQTFGRYLSQGMLPNVFPEANETPAYNTVDATLWYFNAIAHYSSATGDWTLVEELFPALASVIDWHLRGTRYNIHCDSQDGLLYAGEPGVQLTWMDAKVGNWVVTPRQGKPVEINALWYNALVLMQHFAQRLGQSPQPYATLATQTHQGFQRFWHREVGYCFDVIDSPDFPTVSPALRPNQLLAVTLPNLQFFPNAVPPLLTLSQRQAVVNQCGHHLLTSYGLRSLSPQDSQYQGHYGGSWVDRDGAYHQGTVWGWWLGIYAEAHYRVYGNRETAAQILAPMLDQLQCQCVGTLGEIFDGDAPFAPRGAVAQAWTVAEWLRVWDVLGMTSTL